MLATTRRKFVMLGMATAMFPGVSPSPVSIDDVSHLSRLAVGSDCLERLVKFQQEYLEGLDYKPGFNDAVFRACVREKFLKQAKEILPTINTDVAVTCDEKINMPILEYTDGFVCVTHIKPPLSVYYLAIRTGADPFGTSPFVADFVRATKW